MDNMRFTHYTEWEALSAEERQKLIEKEIEKCNDEDNG